MRGPPLSFYQQPPNSAFGMCHIRKI